MTEDFHPSFRARRAFNLNVNVVVKRLMVAAMLTEVVMAGSDPYINMDFRPNSEVFFFDDE